MTWLTACTHLLSNAISSFPSPKNITDARSWFGLVNQVAWAYSLSPIMLPFRELVKKNSNFAWNEGLEKAFQQSKQVIVGLVKKERHTSQATRPTRGGGGEMWNATMYNNNNKQHLPEVQHSQNIYCKKIQIWHEAEKWGGEAGLLYPNL